MQNLQGTVALVTGASRGVGKGVALELAKQGAVVYFTGRTLHEKAGVFDLSNSHSPEFVGMAVSALYRDAESGRFSGEALDVLKLALRYGYTDLDGTQPQPET